MGDNDQYCYSIELLISIGNLYYSVRARGISELWAFWGCTGRRIGYRASMSDDKIDESLAELDDDTGTDPTTGAGTGTDDETGAGTGTDDDIGSGENESFGEPGADRPPTPEEERLAEKAAADVDVDKVAENYQDMADKGVHHPGEGRVE
jgi:hypothetical protein